MSAMESIEQMFIKQEPEDTECDEKVEVEVDTSNIENNTIIWNTEIDLKIEKVEPLDENDVSENDSELDNGNVETKQRTIEIEGSASVNGKINRLNCPECPSTFKQRATLKNHLIYSHPTEDDARECKICCRTFKSAIHLRMHNYSVHANVDGISCELCGKKFVNKKKLYNHKFFAHPKQEENVICAVCSKVFPNKYLLKVHIRVVHPEGQNVKCEECKKEFKSHLLLQRHMKWIHPEDGMSYRCQECGRVLPSLLCYNKHLKNVHEQENFNCDGCDKSFRTNNSLQRHIKTFHQGLKPEKRTRSRKIGQYECDKCDKKFSIMSALTWHQERVHSQNKSIDVSCQHTCQLCSKEFSDRNRLRRHTKRVHTMEPAQCNICSKTFRSYQYMQRHVKVTHAPPEAAKTCKICQKTFKCAMHLAEHVYAVHPKGGRVSCDICKKEFSSTRYLLKHEKTHTRGRDFPCDICGNYYKSIYDVNRHKSRMHMEIKLDGANVESKCCLKCGLNFEQDADLHAHIVTCGKDQPDIKIEIEVELTS